MRNKLLYTGIFILIVSAMGIGVVKWQQPTVDSVMHDFHHPDGFRAEDMLMDPLILNADLVKDRVIKEIKDPTMDKRRYAIGFLGNARVKEALPTLRNILANEQEVTYIRADALESIYQISPDEGRSLAEKYKSRDDFLGKIAGGLLDGSHEPFERTYFQALRGCHGC